MKPQLYSIVILLLTRINYVQNAENSNQVNAPSATQLSTFPTTTSSAKPPEGNVTDVTQVPGDHKISVPETTEDEVTTVTDAPKGNTSVSTVTVLSEAPNSQTASAPSSLAPNVSPVRTTKGFTRTTGSGDMPRATRSTSVSIGNQTSKPGSGDTPRATRSTSISIGNQTSKPVVPGKATTGQSNKVTSPVRKTTKLTATKSTTGNRTSAFPVPSLFAILLLVVSVLCF